MNLPTSGRRGPPSTTRRPSRPSRPAPLAQPARRHALAALAALITGGSGAALLSGCGGSLLPKPAAAPARFTLDDGAAAPPPSPAAAGAPVLLVALPRAAPGCDSPAMVYQRQRGQLQAFAFHAWVDSPANMLWPLLLRALQQSGAFKAVLAAPSAAAAGLRLETEMIRLQQDFSHPPSHLRLTLRAVLLDIPSRQTLAWREFDVQVPTAADHPVAGAAAAQQATAQVLAALAAFCAEAARRGA